MEIRDTEVWALYKWTVLSESRRMGWAGHVAHMGRGEAYTWFWWGNMRERGHLGDTGVDGRIILRWVFRKWDVGYGLV